MRPVRLASTLVVMRSGAEVRQSLVAALQADLVGPFDPNAPEPEVLPLAPSRWYLTGFVVPEGNREVVDLTAQDDGGAGNDEADDDGG